MNFQPNELSTNQTFDLSNHNHHRRRRRPENGVFSGCRDKLNQVFVAADVLQTFNVVPLLIKNLLFLSKEIEKAKKLVEQCFLSEVRKTGLSLITDVFSLFFAATLCRKNSFTLTCFSTLAKVYTIHCSSLENFKAVSSYYLLCGSSYPAALKEASPPRTTLLLIRSIT